MPNMHFGACDDIQKKCKPDTIKKGIRRRNAIQNISPAKPEPQFVVNSNTSRAPQCAQGVVCDDIAFGGEGGRDAIATRAISAESKPELSQAK